MLENSVDVWDLIVVKGRRVVFNFTGTAQMCLLLSALFNFQFSLNLYNSGYYIKYFSMFSMCYIFIFIFLDENIILLFEFKLFRSFMVKVRDVNKSR